MDDELEYEIKSCEEDFFVAHADEFAQLCRESFAEHANRNVNMGPCTMTTEHWIELSKGCIGEYIECEGKLIAVWLVKVNYKSNQAYGKILAVHPKYKGKHLGYSLSISLLKYLKGNGINIFKTDTSLKAPHVVRFHKSYGSKAVGMTSWPNTNYYTVMLRLALNPEYEISDREARIRFFMSGVKCRALLREDGSRTIMGTIVHTPRYLFSKIKHLIFD